MHALRSAHPPTYLPEIAARRLHRRLSVRNLHANPLLHRTARRCRACARRRQRAGDRERAAPVAARERITARLLHEADPQDDTILFGRSLFGEPPSEPERPTVHIANVDGASRGNPGPASYAVIVRGPDGATVFELGKYSGADDEQRGRILRADQPRSTTRRRSGIERLRVRSDSELLVRQMQGRYKVKSPDLRPLHERAQKTGAAAGVFRHRARSARTESRRRRAGQHRARRDIDSRVSTTRPRFTRWALLRRQPSGTREHARLPKPARGARPRSHLARATPLARCIRSKRSIWPKAKSSKIRRMRAAKISEDSAAAIRAALQAGYFRSSSGRGCRAARACSRRRK